MFLLLKSLVNSFFTNLLPLSFWHTELIKLSNIQLIPILAYPLIYNSLPNNFLDTLDHSPMRPTAGGIFFERNLQTKIISSNEETF